MLRTGNEMSSGCADWSAHDVVRHLCDCSALAAGAGPDDRALDITAGFDPRITPRGWLTASADESPGATLGRFVVTTGELLALLRARLAQNRRFNVRLPYGPMDWTVFALHGFWDSWLHERDVLLARGTEYSTDDDATAYATAYGLFIAVTLTVTRVTTTGPPAAEVADALAGRSPATAVLGDVPASTRAALSHLANFFNTPVEQNPA
jgi:mycothiol maleylpyruvate isomerase-like protein